MDSSPHVGASRRALLALLAALLCGVLMLGAPPSIATAAPAAPEEDPLGAPIDPIDVAEEAPDLPDSPPTAIPLTGGLGDAWNLGVAAESSAITGAAFDSDGAWVVTRSQVPAALYRWDHERSTVTSMNELPIGTGSWSVVEHGDSLVIGTFSPGALAVFSPETGTFDRVVRLRETEIVMDMAVRPDGTVAVGTYHPDGARLLSFDPESGASRTLASWPGTRYVRSVAVVGEAIYAGLGTPASLWRWHDGHASQVDTEGLETESLVYSLTTDGTTLYGGTEPSGHVFTVGDVVPSADPPGREADPPVDRAGDEEPVSGYRILAETGTKTVDALALADETLYYTARPDGALYSLDLGSRDPSPVHLGTPARGAETRQLFPTPEGVFGMTGTADLWLVGPTTETTTMLTEHGAPTGPESSSQGVDYLDSEIMVAGHWRFHRHSPDGSDDTVVRVSGEPKATVSHDGVLYAATYPGAEIHRLSPGSDESELLARIPGEQMRPRDVILREASGDLLVSTRPAYGLYGGDLTMVDPASGNLTSFVRPFGDHTVTAMVDWGEDVVVGTETYGEAEGTAPDAGPALVARWHPGGGGTVRWSQSIDDAPMVTSVTEVQVGVSSYVLAATNTGTVALLDAASGRIIWAEDLGGVVDQLATVADRTIGRIDGRLYELHVTLRGVQTLQLMNDPVRWVAMDPNDENSFVTVAPTTDGSPVLWRATLDEAPRPERIGGDNRFETAVEVSKTRFAAAETVVLVRYDDFADTLAAAPLASRLDGPILYTSTHSLAPETAAEIERLGAREVIIVGAEGVVSAAVEASLRSDGLSVSRLGGQDRYSTASAVAARVGSIDGGRAAPVFLVTGTDFPDGLSAAPAAARTRGVVLLTQGTTMPATTRDYLATHRTATVYTVGGPAQQAAESSGIRIRSAFTGNDRYETSVRVAQYWFAHPRTAYLANGSIFADALAAAPPAGRDAAPVVLTVADRLTKSTHDYFRDAAPDEVIMIGGPGVISDGIWMQIRRTVLE